MLVNLSREPRFQVFENEFSRFLGLIKKLGKIYDVGPKAESGFNLTFVLE
jgi:hypothetical protein